MSLFDDAMTVFDAVLQLESLEPVEEFPSSLSAESIAIDAGSTVSSVDNIEVEAGDGVMSVFQYQYIFGSVVDGLYCNDSRF